MPPRHPLASLLENAIAVRVGEDEEKLVFPFKEAQRERLSDLAAKAGRCTFARGDFVRYVAGSGPFKKEAREQLLLMYWRRLDFDNAADAARLDHVSQNEMGQMSTVDCLLVRYDGHSIVFDVSSSEMLERDDATG